MTKKQIEDMRTKQRKDNKPIRVMYNGKPLRKIYPHATGWQVFKFKLKRFVRRVIWLSIIAVILYGIYIGGGIMNPATLYLPSATVVQEVEAKAPILDKIAKCESPTGHWRNGQVSFNGNKDGSTDIGKYQINDRIWGKKATELGYNLTVEKDNEAMAHWIYENRGTEDWVWSKKCWNK
jgi:hypothetical protein